MIKIIVRAVKERTNFVEYLQKAVPGIEVCYDTNKNCMHTFLSALKQAGDEPCIHMEEDVIVTSSFIEKAEAAISQHPDNCIQFFSMYKKDLTDGSRWATGKSFSMNQCFYLPKGYSKLLFEYSKDWIKPGADTEGYDYMMGDFFQSRKERYWINVPSLVQHRISVSMINSSWSSKRQSLTFLR